MNTVRDFAASRPRGRKISMVTAYDAWSARLVARSHVDAILVGDSAAMVMHGHPTTLAATVELMALHTRAVARSAAGKFVIADLPFLSFRKGDRRRDDRGRRARHERGAGGQARRRGRPRGRHPTHRRVRRAGHGPHRPDAAIGQSVRRLPRAGDEATPTRQRSSARRTRSRIWVASRSCSSACPRRWPRASRRS